MSDLISRQSVITAIQNDYEDTECGEDKCAVWKNVGLTCALHIIQDMPSAHPEIVRCKDCKHQVKEWRTDKRLKDNGYMVCGCDVVGDACGFWALLGQDDDYCSFAERRSDG